MDEHRQGNDLILLRPRILERKRVYLFFWFIRLFFSPGRLEMDELQKVKIHCIILRETRPFTNAMQSII